MSTSSHVCEPCQRESYVSEELAVVFCTDCQEYLCESCKTSHLKSKASLKHVLTDLASGPPPKVGELLQKLTACSKHHDLLAVYLCQNHDSLCCYECFFEEHRRCDHVDTLVSLTTGDGSETDNDSLSVDVESMLDKYERHAASLLEHENNQRASIDDTERSVNETLTEVKNIFDKAYLKIETKVRADFDTEKQTLLQTITTQTCGLEKFTNDVIETKETMAIVRDHGNQLHNYLLHKDLCRVKTGQLNATLKGLHESVAHAKLNIPNTTALEKAVEGIEKEFNVTREEINVSLDDCPDVHKSINVTATEDLEKQSDDVTATPYTERTPVLLGSLDVQYINYVYNASSCTWVGQNIVISTFDPPSLHLVDTTTLSVIDSYQCKSEPTSARPTDDNTVVACLPGTSSMLQIHIVNNKLTDPRIIKTKTAVCDVAVTSDKDKMIGLCRDDGSLVMLDRKGSQLSSVTVDSKTMRDIRSALKLCFDKSQTTIFVACTHSNKLIAIDLNGKVQVTYTDDNFKVPVGLDVDNEGNIYVCSNDGHSIHQVNSRGEKVRELLKGDVSYPTDIAFNRAGDKFAVMADNSLKIYSFE